MKSEKDNNIERSIKLLEAILQCFKNGEIKNISTKWVQEFSGLYWRYFHDLKKTEDCDK